MKAGHDGPRPGQVGILGTTPPRAVCVRSTPAGQWIRAGKMKWEETIVDGIANAPQAFLGLFTGANAGKMLVRLGPDRVG